MANQFSTEEGRKAAKLLRDEKRDKRYEALGWSHNFLTTEFIDKNRTLQDIADEYNVGIKFLRGALSYYDIVKPMDLRVPKGRKNPKLSEALKVSHSKRTQEEKSETAAKAWAVRRSNTMIQLASKGITLESLTELYITQNKSQKDLMVHFEASKNTIRSWLEFFGIKKTETQRDTAKEKAFAELYADEERVAEMTRKAQTTIRERYGNSWYRVTSSKEELAVEAFLKETFPKLEISRGDYSVIHKGGHGGALQLDFYFPKFSLAIEYNGEYWHDREAYEEDVANGTELSRERMKDRLCSEKGILLYHLWSSDWKKDSENAKLELVKLIEEAIVITS